MALSQAASELVSKYTALLGQVGEFLLVSALVYVAGRFVVEPVVRWVFARRALEPTLELYIQALTERCGDAGIDLTTTSQHDLSGDLTVHGLTGP